MSINQTILIQIRSEIKKAVSFIMIYLTYSVTESFHVT